MNQVFLDRLNHSFECKLLAYSEPLPSGVKQVLNTGVKHIRQ